MQCPMQKVAAIHDLSGFGRGSLTSVIPILSCMGIQVCPVPTAVLSTHTEFEDFSFVDLTSSMLKFLSHWKKLNLQFECIYSGFLGSSVQVDIVLEFIRHFARSNKLVVVDPVLGDSGRLYEIFDQKMVKRMREMVAVAKIITPNFTEMACLLGEEYEQYMPLNLVQEKMRKLSDMGPSTVVLTSVPDKDKNMSSVVAYEREDGRFWKVDCEYLPAAYPGTGDTFASVLVGSLLQGESLPMSLDRAVQFVSMAIRSTFGYSGLAQREGVLLEKVLHLLSQPLTSSTYHLVEEV